jgi:UDP-glucuronate decarboxylase
MTLPRTSIRELAEKVIAMTGSRSKLVFGRLPRDDLMQRQPDISLARSTVAWEPKIGAEKIYFDQLLAA